MKILYKGVEIQLDTEDNDHYLIGTIENRAQKLRPYRLKMELERLVKGLEKSADERIYFLC